MIKKDMQIRSVGGSHPGKVNRVLRVDSESEQM